MPLDFIAMAETLEAQAASLRREAARLETIDQPELELPPPAIAPAALWPGWPGGEQPEETYGKTVDVHLRNNEIKSGPAEAFTWNWFGGESDIIAYRISAEQP